MEIGIIKTIQSVANNFWDIVMVVFSFFGATEFFVLAFVLLFWCYDKRFAFKFAAIFGAVSAINWGLKEIIMRPRPFVADGSIINYTNTSGYSMPSGHSSAISAISGTIIFEAQKSSKKWFKISTTIILVLLCLCVGFSRMYLGQHYLTDVVAGLALGFAISLVVSKFIKFGNKEHIYALFLLPLLVLGYLMFFKTFATDNFRAGQYAIIFMIGIAIVLGYFFEKTFIKYESAKIWWFDIIKVVAFGGAAVGLYFLLCWALPNLVFFRSIIVLIDILFVMVLCPLCFKKIEKSILKRRKIKTVCDIADNDNQTKPV